MNESKTTTGETIRLAERRIFSDSFRELYATGMLLVEDAASYLDGEGRRSAKGLDRIPATLYAAESMRLTTRLMQIASWLLLQRAANAGEMTREQVAKEKQKVNLDAAVSDREAPGWDSLSEEFLDLVDRSLSLQRLVQRVDAELYGAKDDEADSDAENPVGAQIDLLRTAFGR
ncbi:DUF1465 family protein [Notoacmeibacter ruber]|uniref:DUF1465 family protein n=1 Tax=Notoacmeibacter ruber TaxID=2670375 RepID=A0A3L7JEE8_9HYPH|nr:DUF1465 family protein [Notoacmeibacter ruber]RLQ88689.1 DUF1465 family protein [Notoacmeibacter ruber]